MLDEEVAFLRSELWDGSGGYRELWSADSSDEAGCRSPSITGQLGAIRALIAWHHVHGAAAEDIGSALRTFDARFWNPEAELYVSHLDRLGWCLTPLDLACAVDVIPQALFAIHADEAHAITSHLARFVDRALDAVDLQLPARTYGQDEQRQRYAPVLDRRVCLEPTAPYGGLTWVQEGDVVRYTIQAENQTDEVFRDLVLRDVLPAGITLLRTTPSAIVDGSALQWTADRLDPGDALTWMVDVRVPSGAARGEELQNCATLTCDDEKGEPCPPREACADVTLRSADDALSEARQSASVRYRTDEAMRLATTIEDLTAQGGFGPDASKANAICVANLGVLLGESGLGVPFSESPLWLSPDAAGLALRALAEESGLPGLPNLESLIFLPSTGGVPLLARGAGFSQKEDEITPAAIGWTLAREIQFIDSQPGSNLSNYLRGVVLLCVEGQLTWLDREKGSYGAETSFVHSVRTTGNEMQYNVVDSRHLAYDAASLLIGLARVAGSSSVPSAFSDQAEGMAGDLLSDLVLHIDSDGALLGVLGDNRSTATWNVALTVA